jgi:TolA-binding protein
MITGREILKVLMYRMKAEERERELVRQLTLLQDSHTSAVDRLNKQIGEQKARIESLNSQVTLTCTIADLLIT